MNIFNKKISTLTKEQCIDILMFLSFEHPSAITYKAVKDSEVIDVREWVAGRMDAVLKVTLKILKSKPDSITYSVTQKGLTRICKIDFLESKIFYKETADQVLVPILERLALKSTEKVRLLQSKSNNSRTCVNQMCVYEFEKPLTYAEITECLSFKVRYDEIVVTTKFASGLSVSEVRSNMCIENLLDGLAKDVLEYRIDFSKNNIRIQVILDLKRPKIFKARYFARTEDIAGKIENYLK